LSNGLLFIYRSLISGVTGSVNQAGYQHKQKQGSDFHE
jgi:hypothetical protein